MTFNRKNFLKNMAQLGAFGLLTSSWRSPELVSEIPPFPSPGINIADDDESWWGLVRNQFPIANQPVTYLNNGTMGPSPYPVMDAITQKMNKVDSMGDYGGWEDSRKILAQFMHVTEDEICMTHNVTEGVNIIAQGLAFKKGDEILVTNHEHVGGALPWLSRAHQDNLVVNYFEIGKDAAHTLENLKKKITKKTRAIAVPHIICTTGQIQPVKEIAALGREKNIEVFIDGAHGAGMLNLDLHELGVDYYASCCHKWMCGAKGTGFLYIRKEALDRLKACHVGAGSDTGWNVVDPPSPFLKGYANTAHRFDYGTQNAYIWSGVNAAVVFLQNIGMEHVEARVKYLGKYMQDGLLGIASDRIEMLTSTEAASRGGVIGFKIKGMDFHDFQTKAIASNFRIRIVPENGLNGIRVSSHIYNSRKELDAFIRFTAEMTKK